MQTRWWVTAVAATAIGLVPLMTPANGSAAARPAASHPAVRAAHPAKKNTKFRVTRVIVPKDLYANGPDRTLTVYWKGHATFPVRILTTPRSCPPGLICNPVHHKFLSRTDPLVWKKADHCQGTVPAGFEFKYWLWLVDANGHKTARVKTNTHCYQGPHH